MTLSDLITKLEEAEGPSRELDAALWGLIDPRPLEEAGEGPAIYKRDPVDTIAFDAPPRFTASVDAALALIGERFPGACWRVEHLTPVGLLVLERPFWATCGRPGEQESAVAATPALALCLALLRALKCQEPRHAAE